MLLIRGIEFKLSPFILLHSEGAYSDNVQMNIYSHCFSQISSRQFDLWEPLKIQKPFSFWEKIEMKALK
jgi:hypothetical protein